MLVTGNTVGSSMFVLPQAVESVGKGMDSDASFGKRRKRNNHGAEKYLPTSRNP
jgi:hypothetical protein